MRFFRAIGLGLLLASCGGGVVETTAVDASYGPHDALNQCLDNCNAQDQDCIGAVLDAGGEWFVYCGQVTVWCSQRCVARDGGQ